MERELEERHIRQSNNNILLVMNTVIEEKHKEIQF